MSTQFQRIIEDFTCEQCGCFVKGDGYTNHCPQCLYSKHVDTTPGDRAADCGGLMAPVAYEKKDGEERIVHRCVACGHEKPNRVGENDNRDEVIKIAQSRAV